MKAAIKFIMTLTGLLLIGMAIATVLLLTQFEGALRSALTHQASRILQCDVHLESLRIDWSEQALLFKGVSLFNPTGFTDREAVRVGTLLVKPEPLTLFSRTPGVSRISLKDAEVHLQYKVGTGTNVGTLMDHARLWAEKQEAAEEPVWGRRVLLREIQAAEVAVKAEGLVPPTPTIPVTVPPFSVEDPGGEAAVSGAKAMHLMFRGFLRQLRQLDTVIQPLRELLVAGDTEP